MRAFACAFTLAALTAAPSALAEWEEIPAEAAPKDSEAADEKRPTHFIAELSLGSSLQTPAPVLGGVMGLGGKLRGFPPIFYLIGELGYGRELPAPNQSHDPYGRELSFTDLTVGTRIYLPVLHPLRIFVDGGFGTTELGVASTAEAPATRQWVSSAHLAGGLQARLFHHWSVGARVRALWHESPSAPELSGRQGARTSFMGTLTAHF